MERSPQRRLNNQQNKVLEQVMREIYLAKKENNQQKESEERTKITQLTCSYCSQYFSPIDIQKNNYQIIFGERIANCKTPPANCKTIRKINHKNCSLKY